MRPALALVDMDIPLNEEMRKLRAVCAGFRLIEHLSQVPPGRNDPLVYNSHPLIGILACQLGVMLLSPFDIIPVLLWRGLGKCVITHFLTSVEDYTIQ